MAQPKKTKGQGYMREQDRPTSDTHIEITEENHEVLGFPKDAVGAFIRRPDTMGQGGPMHEESKKGKQGAGGQGLQTMQKQFALAKYFLHKETPRFKENTQSPYYKDISRSNDPRLQHKYGSRVGNPMSDLYFADDPGGQMGDLGDTGQDYGQYTSMKGKASGPTAYHNRQESPTYGQFSGPTGSASNAKKPWDQSLSHASGKQYGQGFGETMEDTMESKAPTYMGMEDIVPRTTPLPGAKDMGSGKPPTMKMQKQFALAKQFLDLAKQDPETYFHQEPFDHTPKYFGYVHPSNLPDAADKWRPSDKAIDASTAAAGKFNNTYTREPEANLMAREMSYEGEPGSPLTFQDRRYRAAQERPHSPQNVTYYASMQGRPGGKVSWLGGQSANALQSEISPEAMRAKTFMDRQAERQRLGVGEFTTDGPLVPLDLAPGLGNRFGSDKDTGRVVLRPKMEKQNGDGDERLDDPKGWAQSDEGMQDAWERADMLRDQRREDESKEHQKEHDSDMKKLLKEFNRAKQILKQGPVTRYDPKTGTSTHSGDPSYPSEPFGAGGEINEGSGVFRQPMSSSEIGDDSGGVINYKGQGRDAIYQPTGGSGSEMSPLETARSSRGKMKPWEQHIGDTVASRRSQIGQGYGEIEDTAYRSKPEMHMDILQDPPATVNPGAAALRRGEPQGYRKMEKEFIRAKEILKEVDPLKSGESFTTLNNYEARKQEHDQLLREYGFPSEQDPEANRYSKFAEVETDGKGVVMHNKPPWIVAENSELVSEINDEDAPSYSKSPKAKNREGADTISLKKEFEFAKVILQKLRLEDVGAGHMDDDIRESDSWRHADADDPDWTMMDVEPKSVRRIPLDRAQSEHLDAEDDPDSEFHGQPKKTHDKNFAAHMAELQEELKSRKQRSKGDMGTI